MDQKRKAKSSPEFFATKGPAQQNQEEIIFYQWPVPSKAHSPAHIIWRVKRKNRSINCIQMKPR